MTSLLSRQAVPEKVMSRAMRGKPGLPWRSQGIEAFGNVDYLPGTAVEPAQERGHSG